MTITLAIGSILLFSTALALAVGKGIRKADEANVSPAPEDDSLWLDVWPNEIDEQAAMNREFVFMISNEWEWSE
jgi:hypothetical protein